MPRPASAPMIACEFCRELVVDSSYWRMLVRDEAAFTAVAHDGCHTALAAVMRLGERRMVSFWRVAPRAGFEKRS